MLPKDGEVVVPREPTEAMVDEARWMWATWINDHNGRKAMRVAIRAAIAAHDTEDRDD